MKNHFLRVIPFTIHKTPSILPLENPMVLSKTSTFWFTITVHSGLQLQYNKNHIISGANPFLENMHVKISN